MKKMWVFFLALALGAGFSLGVSMPVMADNCGYVVNGDFESIGEYNPLTEKYENFGFTTDYLYLGYPLQVNYDVTWLMNAGEMTIVENPGYVHDWGAKTYWPTFVYADGNMLVVNGSTSATKEIWRQTFNLRPNTNYVFSFDLANVCVENDAIARIKLHKDNYANVVLGPVSVPADEDLGDFHRFEVTIDSGPSGTFALFFTNNNTEASGNDFAIDNICMKDIGLMVDIKPGSCPNAFNLKQKGLMPAAIMGSPLLDVAELDMNSVKLCLTDDEDNCISPVKVELLDAGIFCSECKDCNCISYDPVCVDEVCVYDDINDLALKFNSTDIVDLLGTEYTPGDFVEMIIKANYYESNISDQPELQGQDCIIIVNK
jgi:hypothetical protein